MRNVTGYVMIGTGREPLGRMLVERRTLALMARAMRSVVGGRSDDDVVYMRGWTDTSGTHLSFGAEVSGFAAVSECYGDGGCMDHVGGGVRAGFVDRIVSGEVGDRATVTFVSGGIWVTGCNRKVAAAWVSDEVGEAHWELRRRARLRGGRRIVTNRDRLVGSLRAIGVGDDEFVSIVPWRPRVGLGGVVLDGGDDRWRHVRCECMGDGGDFVVRVRAGRLSAALSALRWHPNVSLIVPDEEGGDVRIRCDAMMEQVFMIGQGV